MKRVLTIMAVAITLSSCGDKTAKVPAIDMANLDQSTSPAVDFYQYSTGGWQKNHPLTAEYARFGSFDQLRENNVTRLNELFAEMAQKQFTAGSSDQKIADLYKMGLDSVRLNSEGAEPLKQYVDAIYAVKTKDGLAVTYRPYA